MANHKSAIKRHKQSLKSAARNRAMRSRIKNAVKEVRAAILVKDTDRAQKALVAAKSVIDKASTKGTVHWKNAARKVSRLSKAVNSIAA
ncbi:30S ribosomal protein S20 [Desulfovibrio sp. OttesenSCG-928-C06]|nr:30S ribosomal protein S20 [Desulfovibrio sp. OttesenSCG-928-C06]